MEERSELSRVEVELSSTSPQSDHRWRRRDGQGGGRVNESAAATGQDSDSDRVQLGGDALLRTDSTTVPLVGSTRRALAVGLAAGMIGVAIGWMLGGSSGPADQSASAPVTARVTMDVAEAVGEEALEPLDPVRPPTTLRPPRTTTTTTLAPPTVEQVALNSRLAGADFRIVGIVGNSATAEIDLATGSMTSQQWSLGYLDPYSTTIGDGWIAATNNSSGQIGVAMANGEVSSPNVGEPWSLLWIQGTDLFWRGADREHLNGHYLAYEQVNLAGEPTGPTIDGHGGIWPSGVDPLGGVLTVFQGKTYSLREDGVAVVGPGELLAISSGHAVLRTCDDQLACGVTVVDRATGEQRVVPIEGDLLSGSSFGFGGFRNEVSPGGDATGLFVPAMSGLELVVIDLVTGDVVELADATGASGLSWSPDGRFGMFVDGSTPMLYERATGAVEPLGDDIGMWSSVEARPARP